jgi:sugar-specific transcriptional regulator TrmB
MLGSTKLMDALKGIGLNLYERRLWVALIARGTSTAGELSEIANVPRSRVYDVLQGLAEKGFVVVQASKPIRYVAISPEESLERVKKKMEEEFVVTKERIDDFKDSPLMKEMNDMFNQGMKIITPEDITGSLKGKYSLHQQMDTMFRDANKSINIITTPEGFNELFDNHLEALKKAKERGVNIKIATSGTEKASEAIKAFNSFADVKTIPEKEVDLAGRFAIVDGKQLVMGLTDAKSVHSTQDMSIWSKSEHAAKDVLEPLFKLVWTHSKSVS